MGSGLRISELLFIPDIVYGSQSQYYIKTIKDNYSCINLMEKLMY